MQGGHRCHLVELRAFCHRKCETLRIFFLVCSFSPISHTRSSTIVCAAWYGLGLHKRPDCPALCPARQVEATCQEPTCRRCRACLGTVIKFAQLSSPLFLVENSTLDLVEAVQTLLCSSDLRCLRGGVLVWPCITPDWLLAVPWRSWCGLTCMTRRHPPHDCHLHQGVCLLN